MQAHCRGLLCSGQAVWLSPTERRVHLVVSAGSEWAEDAHNCIPDLDSETAMFSVYDGHGGEEVALYCSKYLPEIIKEQKAYKEGKLQKALEDAFLAIDAKLTTEEVIKELTQIAGRPQEDDDEKEKVADEDDVDKEETALLHEEATMTIEELLTRYGQNCSKSLQAKPPPSGREMGQEGPQEPSVNGEAGPEEEVEHKERKNGKLVPDATGVSSAANQAETGDTSHAPKKVEEAVASPTGEAGPSCSCTGKPQRATKSKFFEDSEDESEAEAEEEEESEEEEEDTEEIEEEEEEEEEEDEEEEEEMMLPGMEGKEEVLGLNWVGAWALGFPPCCGMGSLGAGLSIPAAGGEWWGRQGPRRPALTSLPPPPGDHFYKRNKNLPPEEQMISALPDIKVLTINDDHDFMVIACDGIWNVMSSQEVVDFIQSKIPQKDENGELRPLSSIVEELLDRCLAPDTSGDGTGCDNMTCIIISFKPHPSKAPGAGSGKRKLEEVAAAAAALGPSEENGSKKSKRE
uniref:protein-serine/threonine phosphatase n=1 Tax=Sphenodon punctatus TaxID=8508 RepID=A0A8D0H1G4_SPHPU